MLKTRQNIHRHKLPQLGEVFKFPPNLLRGFNPKDKYIVVAFPLCDNVRPYSLGIHTCFIQSLANGKVKQLAGHWVTGILSEY